MKYSNYVNGNWERPSSGEYYTIINPGNKNDILGEFPLSKEVDVNKAVECAYEAFQVWGKMLPDKRAEYVYKFIDILEENVDRLGEILCREQGKVLVESIGEVSRGLKECRYIVGESTRMEGMSIPSERENVTNSLIRTPIGVIAAITPWNFPILTPIRKIIPALVAGCTVVFKPSYETPLCAISLIELFEKAGFPQGVINLIMGRGSSIGDCLCANEKVNGISFTGSTTVGRQINTIASQHFAKVQLEMGGKNPAVVVGFDDLEFAAKQICTAAFANAGQRCTAISRVIVAEEQSEELEQELIKEIKNYKVGYGFDKGVQVGPVINEQAGKDIIGYIEGAKKEGATIAIGGNQLEGKGSEQGFYIAPTLITNVTSQMAVANEEVFGPVLVVIKVKSFDEAVKVANSTQYGLAASIFTRSQSYVYDFIQEIDSGMVHINHGTVSESFMPFGGVKNSGLGEFGIGKTNKNFYTTWKVVYNQYKQ